MTVTEAIRHRRATREFEPDRRIPRETWNELFELAQLAPSSFNLQGWRYLVVEDPATKSRIQEAAYGQKQVGGASAVILVLGDGDPLGTSDGLIAEWVAAGELPEAVGASYRGMLPNYYADAARARDFAIQSSALGAMTLMLAAEGLGLATGPMIGFDQAKVAEIVGGLPESLVINFMIVIGYPAGPPSRPRQSRLGTDRVVFWERVDG